MAKTKLSLRVQNILRSASTAAIVYGVFIGETADGMFEVDGLSNDIELVCGNLGSTQFIDKCDKKSTGKKCNGETISKFFVTR